MNKFEVLDLLTTRAINTLRGEASEQAERVLNGYTPGDEYFTHTGYLRGLRMAEEIVKKAANDILKDEDE